MWRGPYIGCPTCLTYAPGPETSFYTAQQKMSSRTDYFRGGPIFSENFSPRTEIFIENFQDHFSSDTSMKQTKPGKGPHGCKYK